MILALTILAGIGLLALAYCLGYSAGQEEQRKQCDMHVTQYRRLALKAYHVTAGMVRLPSGELEMEIEVSVN